MATAFLHSLTQHGQRRFGDRRSLESPAGQFAVDLSAASGNAACMWQRAGWIRLAGAISSGLLVAGLFPPFHAVGLAWVALVPLLPCLWSLDGQRRGWHGFGLAWLAGSVSSSIQFSWMAVVSPLAAVLLPLYLGLFWGLFGAFAATLGNPWHKRAPNGKAPAHHGTHAPHGTHGVVPAPVVSPTPSAARLSLRTAFCHGAVWAGTEWLRSWLFTGFGWNGLGVAFHDTLVLAQAADLLGVTGLSLALVFFQSVLVLVGRRMWLSRSDGKRRPRWDLSVAALLMGLLPCYGLARIHAEGLRKTVRLKALLVQLNIPQDAARMLWDDLTIHRAYEDETLSALAKLANATESNTPATAEKSAPPAPRWPDWVIWPESALQGRIMRSADGGWGTWQENLDTIAQVRTAGPFSLIFGVNEMEAEPTGEQLIATPGGRMYNSLAIMSADDELQTFRKHHLVIFGETIPYVDSLPFLKDIYAQQAGVEYGGSFTSGDSFEPMPVKVAGTYIGVIPSVCFEDSVPRLTRHFVRPGPQVIINVTNDGWFKQSTAASQHFANARFRAIELRRPMLRCANTGVSAAVNTCGSTAHPDTGARQVLADATGSHFSRGSLLAELDVPLKPSFTLYGLIGDGGIILLALLGLGIPLLTRPRRPRTLPATSPKHPAA